MRHNWTLQTTAGRGRAHPARGRAAAIVAGLAIVLAGHGGLRGFGPADDGPPRARLSAISAQAGPLGTSVRIEASEPVAYVTARPDPMTILVELRHATAAGVVNRLASARVGHVAAATVEDAVAGDGAKVARVQLLLAGPVAHHVRAERNVIQVDVGGQAATSPPAGAAGPSPEAMRQATRLESIRTASGPKGVEVTLAADGALPAAAPEFMKDKPVRLFFDLAGVAPNVPEVTKVGQGPVTQVRVARRSAKPLVTRVVFDLASRVPFRVQPVGHELKVLFGDGAADAPSAPSPAAAPATAAAAPPRVPAPMQVPASISAPQAGSAPRQYTGHPISLDFQGADLRSVLRTFSEVSALNIVIDPAVQGSVDVALRDVPWDQALDIILRANKLGYVVDGTIVRIAPLSVLADEESQRRKLAEEQALSGDLKVVTRALSYAKAEDLKDLLVRSALSKRGDVQFDPRTNTLILRDLPASLETAVELLEALDRPQPQVEIEARIVQTTRDFSRSIGVQWGITGRVADELGNTTGLAFPNKGTLTGRTGARQGGETGSATAQAVGLGVSTATSALGLTLGSVNGAFNLDVALSALEKSGQGRVLSSPRVSTQNNMPAEMTQGTQIPIQTVANNTVTVTFKDATLTLKVTPQITAANTVIMNIQLENASPDYTRAVGTSQIPPIDTQRAITTVLVRDGETTVIGGIEVSREQAQTDRTPGLSRIPILKWLFKRDAVQDENRELLIFITPRIVKL
ncbi:MAG: type IV pilus secretin PilQ [Acidobacteria bacterium]|nr:type IV pilus secretin PilQ [Acidobacteriota bacterium]